jgi:hypothetical protein
MSKVTSKKVKEWVKIWNEYNPEVPMGCTFSSGYAAIGHLKEHGSLDIICSGETPREAWDQFCCWKAGFGYAEKMYKNL